MSQVPPFVNRAFERKVNRARWAGLFEQLWLRFWIVAAVAAVFALVSFAGLWEALSKPAHIGTLAVFAVALIAGLVYAGPLHWLTRDEALRRIETVSGIPHRPASSYEDTLSSTEAANPETATLWQAHRLRMLAVLQRLRVGPPRPKTHRFDPFAVRSALVIGVLALAGLSWGSIGERLKSAFDFGPGVLATARLDAWVSPPPYTARPPIMLADGAKPVEDRDGNAAAKPVEVPVNSALITRLSGVENANLALEVLPEGAKTPVRVEPAPTSAAVTRDSAELRYDVKANATVRVVSGATELASWKLAVIPDAPPTIEMNRKPEVTPRGSMKLSYKVKDDYGVAAAEAKVERVAPKATDPAKAWAQPDALKGPRWPKERPPQLTLKVPPGNAKEGDASTYIEFGSHPWSGQRVQLTLEAKDVAGQIGRSPTIEIILPQRRFTKPLARAVIEQRAKLVEDHRYRDQVVTALDALTMEPEGFIDDTRVYLGLRTASYRLQGDRTRLGMKSVVKQLWDVALKIEDGDLSDAEKALREAQEKLSKALEEGASEEEIKQAMQELRDAMNNYMEQLAKDQGEQPFDGQNQDSQTMSQQDMQRMMDNLEQMAKNGSREEAQQMLSEMRDMMERMQQGKQDKEQAQKNEEMLKLMDELGGVVGDQQKLMDETFKERREQGRTPKNEMQKDQQRFGAEDNLSRQQRAERGAKSGQRRGQGQGEKGQQGGESQGQGQQQGQGGEEGEGQRGQGQEGRQGLSQRQRQLRDRLQKLQKGIAEQGGQPSEQLEGAKESMNSAENALGRNDLEGATDNQAQALDQLRQGAQSMAQQMLKNMPQRMGQNGDTPRDPLGRPQRSQGPDLGTAVKVPDQIDMQRAREILEELRRRLGDAQRPAMELDYLERLLKRF